MPRRSHAVAGLLAKLVPHRFESGMRTPTQRLLDRTAAVGHIDTGWGDEYAEVKQADIAAQNDATWG